MYTQGNVKLPRGEKHLSYKIVTQQSLSMIKKKIHVGNHVENLEPQFS